MQTQPTGRDELIARAQDRAETKPSPEEWDYRVVLNEGETFVGPGAATRSTTRTTTGPSACSGTRTANCASRATTRRWSAS